MKDFYGNKPMMESVYLYLLNLLEQKAISKVMSGDDPRGIPLAKEVIDDLIIELHQKYGQKKKKEQRKIR